MRSNLKKLMADREATLGRRISQKELAERTKLHRNTITRWMSPEPFDRFESEPIIKLCTVLDCQIGDLVVIEKDPKLKELA